MSNRSTIVAALVAITLAAPALAGSYVNKQFPDFSAKDAISGEAFKLSDLRGRVVIVDFWATWCAPCRAELPNVKKFWNDNRDRGLEIVGVSLDTSDSKFRSYVRRSGMAWRHVMEGGRWKTRLVRKYGVRSIPTLFVIGPDGTCLAQGNRLKQFEPLIRKALADLDLTPVHAQRDEISELAPGNDTGRLNDLRTELVNVASPLHDMERSLQTQERMIVFMLDKLRTADATTLSKRYQYLLSRLNETRRQLFAMGLLTEVPALPGNPFAEVGSSGETLGSRMATELAVGFAAIKPMKQAVTKGLQQVDPLLDELQTLTVQARRAEPDSWQVQMESVDRRATAVAQMLAGGPPATVARIDIRLGDCTQALTEQAAVLHDIQTRLAGMQEGLTAAANDVNALAPLRSEFIEVATSVKDLAHCYSIDVAVLGDPFEGRRPGDRRVIADAQDHLRIAREVVAILDVAVKAEQERCEMLSAEAQALREAIAARRTDSAFERRLGELADRVLAMASARRGT